MNNKQQTKKYKIMDNYVYSGLAIVALVLMIVVSGGVMYLTAMEWQDRRRRDHVGKANRK